MKQCLFFVSVLGLIAISNKLFSQIVIVAASGGTSVCTNTAVNGSAPGPTTLDTVTIRETTNADIAIGYDTLVLKPPAGWRFWTGMTTGLTFPPAVSDIYTEALVWSQDSIMLSIHDTSNTTRDTQMIYGIQVQPVSITSAPGYIYASRASGFAGIATGPTGTNFGNLAVSPLAITGTINVCLDGTTALANASGGGVWSSFTSTIATVNPSTGQVNGVALGTDTIYYMLPNACVTKTVVNVNNCIIAVKQVPGRDNGVAVYPNPANDELTIEMGEGAYNAFSITNIVGQQVMRQSLNKTTTALCVGELLPGVYFISFSGENGSALRRFVKM